MLRYGFQYYFRLINGTFGNFRIWTTYCILAPFSYCRNTLKYKKRTNSIVEILFVGNLRRSHLDKNVTHVCNKEHKRWVTIPHFVVLLFDIVIIVFAVRVWVDVKQELPEPDHKIRVHGQQWAWNFTHAGPDGTLDTEDDIHTHLYI